MELNTIKKLCKNCGSSNTDTTCYDCGLINDDNYLVDTQVFSTPDKRRLTCAGSSGSKLQKMIDWNMWTNEEKNTYKLKIYTRDLCYRLGITESIIKEVCDTVAIVMNIIKQNEGTKRARVKDGIILSCIEYVSKYMLQFTISVENLAKIINLDIKYVTRAEKIILELINSKKLDLDKKYILSVDKPYDYVQAIIHKQNIQVPQNILEEVQKLIQTCEKNDVLVDHTPLSIGVSCFYYVLKQHNIDVDLKILSDMYNLSIVTVLKTFNKLSKLLFYKK